MTVPTKSPLRLAAFAIDCPDPRRLAQFYGNLLGWTVDEAESNDAWVELADPSGGTRLAFQRDPDYVPPPGGPPTPRLRGVGLPAEVLEQVYCRNAERLLP